MLSVQNSGFEYSRCITVGLDVDRKEQLGLDLASAEQCVSMLIMQRSGFAVSQCIAVFLDVANAEQWFQMLIVQNGGFKYSQCITVSCPKMVTRISRCSIK